MHKSPFLPRDSLLPGTGTHWGAEDCVSSAQGFAPRWSRSTAQPRDIQLLAQTSPAVCCQGARQDAISAAISETVFISEAFPKKILHFPSFVLAQLLWKGKMKNRALLWRALVQTTMLSNASCPARGLWRQSLLVAMGQHLLSICN